MRVTVAWPGRAGLEETARALGSAATIREADLGDEASLAALFRAAGEVDHLFVSSLAPKTAPLRDVSAAGAERAMRLKLWGALFALKHARFRPGGSAVLLSGQVADRPQTGQSLMAAVNATVEGLGRALAVELAPVRVNVVSPGFVPFTNANRGMSEDAMRQMADQVAQRLPARRVGKPEDIARPAGLSIGCATEVSWTARSRMQCRSENPEVAAV